MPFGNMDQARRSIAFTGVVDTPMGRQALLENLSSNESRYTPVGGSAFGYRVVNIAERMVMLEKNGMPIALGIGENKSDIDPAAKSGAATPAAAAAAATPAAAPAQGAPAFTPPANLNIDMSQFQGGGGGRGRRMRQGGG
jgi:hypothetical protein